jgi:hypothetical protein
VRKLAFAVYCVFLTRRRRAGACSGKEQTSVGRPLHRAMRLPSELGDRTSTKTQLGNSESKLSHSTEASPRFVWSPLRTCINGQKALALGLTAGGENGGMWIRLEGGAKPALSEVERVTAGEAIGTTHPCPHTG